LLAGASGAAVAVDCAGGVIAYKSVPEIVSTGQPCVVHEVVVSGQITFTNSPELTIVSVDAGGPLTIKGTVGSATVLLVDVLKGNMAITGNKAAVVGGNILQAGSLFVNDNIAAVVQRNAVNGNLQCTGNTELDSLGNRATGTVDCLPK
jgi:hypothetical protein